VPNTKLTADFYLPSLKTFIEVNGPQKYIKRIENNKIVITNEMTWRAKAREEQINSLGYKFVALNFNDICKDSANDE
jgi:hypothetical protein